VTQYGCCSNCGEPVSRDVKVWRCKHCHSVFAHGGGLAPSLSEIETLKAELKALRESGQGILTQK
jgi:ribosomal protein L37AE/L43A